MAKFVSNGTAAEDSENREAVMIDSDIEEFIALRESVENSNKTMDHWVNQTSKLLESNRNIEMNCDKLMMKISDIDEQMSELVKIRTVKKQELGDLQNARMISSHKKWAERLSEIKNYANNFCQWITEYTSKVLTGNIENFHKECKEVSDGLATLKKELDDMKRKHDSDYVEANTDIQDLSNLNIVISDIRRSNNNLTRIVRLKECSLSEIQKKIEQRKVAVNKYKSKENTNMF